MGVRVNEECREQRLTASDVGSLELTVIIAAAVTQLNVNILCRIVMWEKLKLQ